ncbi:MAG: divergent PAP2 family protein [Candidatus Gracilibacteria bacterium]|jgi:acid phosphatase family membrane protein YuiD|nr:divergent PAP2 family protein [Candidatus Gracilibacteria bacterium]
MAKNIFTENTVLIPIAAVVITEILKLLITMVKKGTLTKDDFFATGGIPSGHSSFVSSISMTVLVLKGIHSIEFAISFVFSFLVIYDAIKLRAEAGKHATVLNSIIGKKLLNERLGHNIFEVLTGIFLGSGISLLILFL